MTYTTKISLTANRSQRQPEKQMKTFLTITQDDILKAWDAESTAIWGDPNFAWQTLLAVKDSLAHQGGLSSTAAESWTTQLIREPLKEGWSTLEISSDEVDPLELKVVIPDKK